MDTQPASLRIRSQLLFVEELPEALRVDGTLTHQPVDGVPVGTPVTLLLRKPASPSVASVVEATVHRWADRLDVVEIELIGDEDRTRAFLSDGLSTLRLDVDPASFV